MVKRKLVLVTALLVWLSGCSQQVEAPPARLTEVFVKDFHSLEPTACTTSDVALTHSEVETFFTRAQHMTRKQVSDNYPTAPCYIEGTLKTGDKLCEWRVTAAATGFIACGGQEWHYACDDCGDLLSDR